MDDRTNLLQFLTTRKSNTFVCDTETSGLSPHAGDRPFALALYEPLSDQYCYVEFSDETYPIIKWLFARKDLTSIWHNAGFDIQMLQFCDIPVNGIVHDTMLMMHNTKNYLSLADLALKKLARNYLSIIPHSEKDLHDWFRQHKIKKADRDYSIAPRALVEPYALDDVRYTYLLYNKLFDHLAQQNLYKNYRLDMSLVLVIIEIENRGNLIDLTYTAERMQLLARLSEENLQKFYSMVGREINLNSPKQVNEYMQERGAPILKWNHKKGTRIRTTPSWGEKVLKKLAKKGYTFVEPILKYKKYSKINKTFYHGLYYQSLPTAEPLPDEIPEFDFQFRSYVPRLGRVHGQYHTITTTYRTASHHPNMQNIPAPKRASLDYEEEAKTILNVRRCFISPKDYTLHYFDYSQLEYRMFAWLVWKATGDRTLLDIYAAGHDFHAYVGAMIHGKDPDKDAITPQERFLGKHTNFACLYGVGPYTLAEMLTWPTYKAEILLEQYRERFPMIVAFQDFLDKQIALKGYIENPFGRRYHLEPKERRLGINYITQGTSGDIFRRAWVRIHRLYQNYKTGIVNAVHDDLAVEVYNSEQFLIEQTIAAMENWPMFDGITFKVSHKSVKYSWGEHSAVLD